jgi:hypothetical protein
MTGPKRRIRAFCLLLTQVIVLFVTSTLIGFAEDVPHAEDPLSSPAANLLGVAHGAHLRPVFVDYGNGNWYSYGNEVMAYNNLVGKDLAIVAFFVPWSAFDPFLLDDILNKVPEERRPTILLAWEPTSNSSGCDLGFGDGQGPLNAINAGRCDGYVRSYARALKARPERFILRFAHEMNISDAAWWPGKFGLDAGSYVTMFRRVRDIFREVGVTNVEWMWSPNYASNPDEAWNSMHNYYPGDAYVDWIGLSGYNWYGWRDRPWESFETLYDGVLRDLACRYAKPVIISEIGSVDQDGSGSAKAAWITNLYARLAEYPFVRGIVWFNDFAYGSRGNADFRVTTGGQDCQNNGGCTGVQALPGDAGRRITDAYVNSIRTSTYISELPTVAQATPPYALCSNPSQPFVLSSNTVVLRPGASATVTLQGYGISAQTSIALELPQGIQGTASPTMLNPPWGVSTIRLTALASLQPCKRTVTVRAGSTGLPITVIIPEGLIFAPFVRP